MNLFGNVWVLVIWSDGSIRLARWIYFYDGKLWRIDEERESSSKFIYFLRKLAENKHMRECLCKFFSIEKVK